MIKLVNISFLILFLSGFVFGCGGGTDTADPVLSEYQFFATITSLGGGTPPFPANIGDTVTGTFSFDPTVQDSTVSPTVGWYTQTDPASVKIEVGSVTIEADLNSYGYGIQIFDNTDSDITRDSIQWYITDSFLAASYGLDRIGAAFQLRDSTQTVFTSDGLPDNLDINNFDHGNLALSGSTDEDAFSTTIHWFFNSKIISVIKVR
jgi:hypothetical protein